MIGVTPDEVEAVPHPETTGTDPADDEAREESPTPTNVFEPRSHTSPLSWKELISADEV